MKKIILILFLILSLSSCEEYEKRFPKSEDYEIELIHCEKDFEIYKITTPTGTYEVVQDTYKGGLCVLK